MRRHRYALRVIAWLLLLAVPCLFRATTVTAQTGGDYTLIWATIDGGGATTVDGGGYALGGTIGQPDAGRVSGGDYVLHAGFFPGGSAVNIEYDLYLPLVLRGS